VQADTLDYQLVVGHISPAPVNVIEIRFDFYQATYNPRGRFVSAEPAGVPAGWFATVNAGLGGVIIRWETMNPGYAIYPGEHLSGFSAIFQLKNPIAPEDLVQVYDVYEFPDKSGDWNKDITRFGYPVGVTGTTWSRIKFLYR